MGARAMGLAQSNGRAMRMTPRLIAEFARCGGEPATLAAVSPVAPNRSAVPTC